LINKEAGKIGEDWERVTSRRLLPPFVAFIFQKLTGTFPPFLFDTTPFEAENERAWLKRS
jgi:hypothetical protein